MTLITTSPDICIAGILARLRRVPTGAAARVVSADASEGGERAIRRDRDLTPFLG